ncbi:hypothetical protein ACIQPS_33080 [Streptomyces sp. NPDC091290]|uniref:hypothetical protein n=1 Tax=Streptomyces sp. NPDC091290 TaxID=3365990 RepID=UPI0037F171DB
MAQQEHGSDSGGAPHVGERCLVGEQGRLGDLGGPDLALGGTSFQQQRRQAAPEFVGVDLLAPVEHPPGGGIRGVQSARHAAACAALPGEGERERPGRCGHRFLQRAGEVLGGAADGRSASRAVRPAECQCGGYIGGREFRPLPQPVAEPAGEFVQGLWVARRHRYEDGQFASGCRRHGRGLLQNYVGVGAAHAERADPGPARRPVRHRPRPQFGG